MRLISCHIENFGGLHDVSLEFRQGCHVICEKNGWGKSTLAAFIRIMLFGFSEEKSRDELKNERKRFKPWQGGVYGGQLEFEAEGKVYCIYRTFGAKEREDEFSLREKDTNLESTRFSSAVGEELFMLDAGSFCRTVFISQNDCETYTTDGINAKLGNLAEDTEDINNYEKVDGRLGELINRLSPRRVTGSLYKDKNDISVMEEQVRNKKALNEDMEKLQTLLLEKQKTQSRLKADQQELTKRQQELGRYKDRQAKREKYADLCAQYEERKSRLGEALSYFPGRLPEEEEVRQYLGLGAGLSAAEEKVKGFKLSEEDKERKKLLEAVFKEGQPDAEELERQEEKIRKLRTLKLKAAEEKLSPEEESRLRTYEKKFGKEPPSEEILKEVGQDWNSRTERKAALEQMRDTLNLVENSCEEKAESLRQTQKKQRLFSGLLWGIGALLAIAGILCGVWIKNWIAGGCLILLAGVLLLGIGAAGRGRKRKFLEEEKACWDEPERLRQEIEEKEAFIQKTESEVEDFLAGWGVYYDESSVQEALYELRNGGQEYLALRKKARELEAADNTGKIQALEQEIQTFLAPYFTSQRLEDMYFDDDMRELRLQIEEYGRLQERERQFAVAEQAYADRIKEIKDFVMGLGMTPGEDMPGQLLDIRSHLQTVLSQKAEYETAARQKEKFEEAEDTQALLEAVPVMEEGLEELSDKLKETAEALETLQDSIRAQQQQLDGLREEADRLEEEESRLAERKQKYEADLRRYELLKKTKELLGQAKTAFTAKYTQPLRSGFQKYYEMLAKESGERYHMDANYMLTAEEKGMQRDVRFFSAGYRDLIGVCMRMALVETMYQAEKPFIIFDDPFANLDQDKMDGALTLLRNIAEEYQILYFTCHESRMYES